MLMNIKLSKVHIENISVGTQAKPDFPGGLENVICISTSPSIYFSFAPSEGRAPAFLHKWVLSKNNLVLSSGPPSPAALLLKASIDRRLLKPSSWFQSGRTSWTEDGGLHVVLEKSVSNFADLRLSSWFREICYHWGALHRQTKPFKFNLFLRFCLKSVTPIWKKERLPWVTADIN